MKELVKKLNQNNNFHLTFKVVQVTDDCIIDKIVQLSKKEILALKNNDNIFENLLNAYNNNVKHIICNEKIEILLPLATFITKENVDVIKPIIPVYYYLKDNRIIQKIKTQCNKTYTSYKQIKTEEELINTILFYIG